MRASTALLVVVLASAALLLCVVKAADPVEATALNTTIPSMALANCPYTLIPSPYTGSGTSWTDASVSNGQSCAIVQPDQIYGYYTGNVLKRLAIHYFPTNIWEYHGSTFTTPTFTKTILDNGELITSITLYTVSGTSYISGFGIITTQNSALQLVGTKPQGATQWTVYIDSQQRVGIFTGLEDSNGIGGLGVGEQCLTCGDAQ